MLNLNNLRAKLAAATPNFQREERYIVIKCKYFINGEHEAYVRKLLDEQQAVLVDCVVVESDWPEYEAVWRMIEDRMTGNALALAPLFEEARREGMLEAARTVYELLYPKNPRDDWTEHAKDRAMLAEWVANTISPTPDDGACLRCDSVPKDPRSGLCATCADENEAASSAAAIWEQANG